jgi:hypothetical protein
MDLGERATDALSRLDDPLNEQVYRLRNFCMIRGAVLERKDVDELGELLIPYFVESLKIGMNVVIEMAKEHENGNNA